jgi:hypothetical protein
MPIKINTANQVVIEPGFMNVVMDIWKERWKALNDEITHGEPRFQKMIGNKNAPIMNRLKLAITKKDRQDYERTQFLCLPFVKFWTFERQGALWLAGLTQPITLSDMGSHRWQGPRYTIYLPRDIASKSTSARLHFVPEGHELAYARHPHHNAYLSRENTHPVDMSPHTCWGSFGTMAQNCTRGGEIANLFRTLHLYLSRVDMHSLLTHPFEACPFTELKGKSR